MDANDFRTKFTLNGPLIDKYRRVYYLVKDVIHINKCETILDRIGCTYQRIKEHFLTKGLLYSEIFFEGQPCGTIDLQGFPSIQFDKGYEHLAVLAAADPEVIAPIPSIHRILDWHEVEAKIHILAGGESICHVMPTIMTEELIQEYVEKLKLQPLMPK